MLAPITDVCSSLWPPYDTALTCTGILEFVVQSCQVWTTELGGYGYFFRFDIFRISIRFIMFAINLFFSSSSSLRYWMVQNIFWKIRNICRLSELWLQCVWTLGKHLHRPQEPKVSLTGWVSPPNSVAFALLSLPPTTTSLLSLLLVMCVWEEAKTRYNHETVVQMHFKQRRNP